jgi:hypothetical protein
MGGQRPLWLAGVVALALAVPVMSIGQSTVQTGRLSAEPGSAGKPQQEFTFAAAAGQRIEVRVSSDDFDTHLSLIPPGDDPFYIAPLTNDDFGASTDSRVTAIAGGSGTWRAVVSAYDDRVGGFSLEIGLNQAGTVRELARRTLGDADSLSIKGRRYSAQSMEIGEESQLLIEMISEAFEPLVIAESPSGVRYTSSESGTEGPIARIDVAAAEPGRWRVLATQAASDEPSGAYSLRVAQLRAEGGEAVTGTLEASDPVDLEGEHYDTHRIEGSAATRTELRLVSSDFDAYLAARSPTGEWFRDDDGAGDSNARLELPAMAGTWLVIVTSFSAAETGRYRLTIGR